MNNRLYKCDLKTLLTVNMRFVSNDSPAGIRVILLLVFLIAALTASIVILAWVPPVSRDALSHHLAVPNLYLKHGGMYEIPHVPFSYYPMNIDLLYLIPLYFGNDIATKYIHFSFALLTAWMIFNYLYKRLDLSYALLGVLFFLSLPIIVKLSITVYVDLGLVFFSTASIIYFLKWIEHQFKLKYLVISACCCGLALGTKYNGLILLFLLTLFVPFVYVRRSHGGWLNQGKATGYAVIFMTLALLIFSPWMIRNYQWKKNPVYPLYQSWFSRLKMPAPVGLSLEGDSDDNNTVAKFKAGRSRHREQVGRFGYRRIIYNESWWETALVPVRIFFTGKDGDPGYFDGKLNPFLFLLPFFAFIHLQKTRSQIKSEKLIWLMFSVLFLLITFFKVEMRTRYIAPIVPPLIILSMVGLHQISVMLQERFPAELSLIPCGVVTAITGIMLLINAVYIVQQFKEVQPLAYMSGKVGRDEYIERYRKDYPAIQYANTHLPSSAKILSIFLGNRIYHSDKTMISDPGMLLKAVRKSDTPQQISMDLKKRDLTHLIIRMDLFDGWIEHNLDERKKILVRLFFKDKTRLIYYKNGYGLFEIVE